MRQKVFGRKSWYSPPPLIHKVFRYRKFSEKQHRRVPLRNFSVLWDKKISTENRDITLWSIKFFDTRNLWHTEGFPQENFRHCDTKIFYKKSWYSPLKHKVFRNRKFSETQHRMVPLRNFSELWDNKFSIENRDIPLWCIKFFDTRKLWHTEGFPYEIFRHCETKNFRQKIVILPPPPLLSIIFCDTRNFVKQRRVPLRTFSVLWDKIFEGKSWYFPLPLRDKTFLTENRDTLLHKVQKSVVKLMFVKTLWKLISKQ